MLRLSAEEIGARLRRMNSTLTREIRRLSPAEKLQLVEELWDEIVASDDQFPISDWHREVGEEKEARDRTKITEGAS